MTSAGISDSGHGLLGERVLAFGTMCKCVVALVLLSAGLLGTPLLAADAFSEIPVSRLIAPVLPDPDWSPPKVASALYQFERPRGWFKEPVTGCRRTVVAVHVNEKGAFVEARIERPSGSETFDEAALKYVAKGQRYSPASVDGRFMEAWTLQVFKFQDEGCERQDSAAERLSTLSYNPPILALIEEAKAKNAALQVEQQKAFDEQEQRRYVVEEPYRTRPSTGLTLERQAVYATELYYNLVHCGDSRFDAEPEYFIHEYKDVRFTYKDADQLTKIDRANGYEWRGRVVFDCEMTRVHGSSGSEQRGWGDWESCRRQVNYVWKRHGKWHVSGSLGERPRRPLSCATVPRA